MATGGEALLHAGRQSCNAIKQLMENGTTDLFSDAIVIHRSRIKRKYTELLCEHLPLAREHAVERQLWKYGFYIIIERYRTVARKVSLLDCSVVLHNMRGKGRR